MQVQFIGVGEAFDERYANTSVLVTVPGPDGPTHVLLDCGFTAAAAYYRHANVGAALDAVWVSHFHGDHFLGLPLLLLGLPLLLLVYRKWGRDLSLAIPVSCGMAFACWGVWATLQSLAKASYLNPLTAAVSVHLVMGIAGFLLLLREDV